MIDRNLNKYWTCQAPISMADNEKLLHYAHKSGGRIILMGIELEIKHYFSNSAGLNN